MPIEYRNYDKDMVCTHFKTTRLMSTYLVTLALYDVSFLKLYNNDTGHKSLLLQDTTFAKSLTFNVTEGFSNIWIYSENLSYVNHLITPKGPQHNGMGLILYK